MTSTKFKPRYGVDFYADPMFHGGIIDTLFKNELDELLTRRNKCDVHGFQHVFLSEVIHPMMVSHAMYKEGDLTGAIQKTKDILALDWGVACSEWLQRRIKSDANA